MVKIGNGQTTTNHTFLIIDNGNGATSCASATEWRIPTLVSPVICIGLSNGSGGDTGRGSKAPISATTAASRGRPTSRRLASTTRTSITLYNIIEGAVNGCWIFRASVLHLKAESTADNHLSLFGP